MAPEQAEALRFTRYLRTVIGLIAATVGWATTSSCFSAARHHPRMPSTRVEVDGEDYEIITCRGANQSNLACPAGEARRFEGALVCKLAGRWTAPVPQELCAKLPNGCKLYVAPRPRSDDSSLPRDYVAALSEVLPEVRECGSARVAFSRVGTSPPTSSDVDFGLKNELQKSIPNRANVAIEVGRCCDTNANGQCANLFITIT
jgi:hypothetical protein